ncbi:helix-turn-helix domain-containing protein (plasmid) [Paenibacillus rhizovicinus]|uniref:Helix-turn-helix domain-containing protein n=1 Tax=Paenibacillus rhizovicinus TaxID=2704463 RepID=A0A6C0PAI6_9BACL|nr:LytTR family transcriptional regulator DNA-binding domain-containing protein [Paenibacillus rhizovicinus]QHW35446.1 helix-turn-helix domain-containing protein [Paenibacillus rhizovicinus]
MSINKIGSHLESLRIACNFSLRKAGEKSGLSHGYIRDVELGENRSTGPQIIPRPKTLRKFAEAYEADFNELMRIAGHVDDPQDSLLKTHRIVEISLDDVLYVQVDENNLVQVHLSDQVYYQSMLLHEYMQFEERLENSDFIRVHVGTYVNLRKIFFYDEKKGRIFFDKRQAGKFIDVAWLRARILRSSLDKAVVQNNTDGIVYKMEPNSSRSLIVRGI